ncbi:MAG: CopG family transcriptional regulator [Candidatus Omnitrophica bacterium]|nr:CopG family transcriptional regulator [Candidatus Omnitrophota bacterium]MCA9449306.1 CopG family transcriptional regulator [Candidatus Omnitrophota bacterium]
MGQVTIYLTREAETKMRSASKSAGMSHSKWIARLIEREVSEEWPDSVRELAGAWSDFPTDEEIRAGEGQDAPREDL